MNSSAADQRLGDRLSSAGLRAVAGEPSAELRGQRLEVNGRPIGVVVPYLAQDVARLSDRERRGVVDALGLRVRYSDRTLHLELSPVDPLERIVFDIAEQFRCEALTSPNWRGVPKNCAAAFERWAETAQAERLTETGVGLLIFTVTHMLRSRLLRLPTTEHVDDVIEVTRGNLSKLVGHVLKPLPSLIDDQRAFAEPAAEIARLIAEMIGDADAVRDALDDERAKLLIPLDWDTLDYELAAADGRQAVADNRGGYTVFSNAGDIEVLGLSMYPTAVLRRLRAELEEHRSAQVVSLARLSLRLQALFGSTTIDGWRGGEDDGFLDTARLAQIIANPTNDRIYKQPVARPSADASVTFLIDTSGSMKLQRYQGVAVLVDTLVRALEMGGMSAEVLGFTTASWGGGRARQEWQAAGRPADPGRVADVQHIVYKSTEQSWRQSRFSLAAMMRTDHYREGVDGEAVMWAAQRLVDRSARRKILVLISDGFPMETSTARINRDGYLLDHLRWACEQVQSAGEIELGAVSLEEDLGGVVVPSVMLDLNGSLTIDTYNVLHRLFG